MANTKITLQVDVEWLKEITKANKLGIDNTWATITQDPPLNQTSTNLDPNDFLSEVEQEDIVTWVGIAKPIMNPGIGNPQPIINITEIVLPQANVADFGPPVPSILTGPEAIFGQGYLIKMKALTSFANPVPYDINFSISYALPETAGRVLDPKIKIKQPS